MKSLIKGIRVNLFSFDNYSIKYLGELCSITTGKLDANAMVVNGKYPFFTCAEETFRIDEYAFDTEALLISGNGANLGYIHYCNGKFNAYQRTYVLDKFAIDVMYIKYYLETFLIKRINQEVNVGNTPYIVLSTLTKMRIKIPDILIQQRIITTIKSLKEKLLNEKLALIKYEEQKKFLLSNMFI
ncbi:MAG: restriction endonuclease subunit S [Bacteroidaceae bacterium]|nr:restriction endonuclease subunit S [Bacteroidaceae bacterium]